jgi:hypothetical protein
MFKDAILGIAIIFVLGLNVNLLVVKIRARSRISDLTWVKQVLAHVIWLSATAILVFQAFSGAQYQTMTIPMALLGLTLGLMCFGLMQPLEEKIIPTAIESKLVTMLSIIGLLIALAAGAFWYFRENWVTALIMMISVVILADAQWPLMMAKWVQMRVVNWLGSAGVHVHNPASVARFRGMSDIIVDQIGILTTADDVTVRQAFSEDGTIDLPTLTETLHNVSRTGGQSFSEAVIRAMAQGEAQVGDDALQVRLMQPEYARAENVVSLESYNKRISQHRCFVYVICQGKLLGGVYYDSEPVWGVLSLNELARRGYFNIIVATCEPVFTGDHWQDVAPRVQAMPWAEVGEYFSHNELTGKRKVVVVSNQQHPLPTPDAIRVGTGRHEADVTINDIDQLHEIYDASNEIWQSCFITMVIWSVLVIGAWVIGMGMQSLLMPLWFVPPILAVIVRFVMTGIVAALLHTEVTTSGEYSNSNAGRSENS